MMLLSDKTFAELYISAAECLKKRYSMNGLAVLREVVRKFGDEMGKNQKELLIRTNQKTNLKHVFDNGWGIPCGDGAVREWIERGEQQLFVNVLACPYAAVWKEHDRALGQIFCEEFYPRYIKSATSEKAQVNLGKTLLNEGDMFCRLSSYLRPANMKTAERKECFAEFDPQYCESSVTTNGICSDEERKKLFVESLIQILKERNMMDVAEVIGI